MTVPPNPKHILVTGGCDFIRANLGPMLEEKNGVTSLWGPSISQCHSGVILSTSMRYACRAKISHQECDKKGISPLFSSPAPNVGPFHPPIARKRAPT